MARSNATASGAAGNVGGAVGRARTGTAARALGVLLIAVLGMATGSADARNNPPAARPELVWPSPPDPARISYVQSIGQPAEAGAKLAAFTKFTNWLGGGDKGNERLLKPFGLALDEEGNLCLTDTGANVVCFYHRGQRKWYRWAKIGRLRFASPVAIAKRGPQIFVADSALGEVVAFDVKGKLLGEFREKLGRPSGLVLAGDRLFVADSQRHAIVSFDLKGRYQGEFGRRGAGPGELNFPTHLATDAAGNLLVTDSLNGRVQRFTRDGRLLGTVGQSGDAPGFFARPKGVAVDPAGRLYVVDALADNFQIFDGEGKLLLSVGGGGQEPGRFWMPNGIAISRDLDIFVADSYNRRVQVFKYVGSP